MDNSNGVLPDPRFTPAVEREPPHYTSLLRRVFMVNAGVLVAAGAVTVAVFAPRDLDAIAAEEAVVLAAASAVMLVLNVVLLRAALAPLAELTRRAKTLDPARAGQSVEVSGPRSEATELGQALNDMLGGLAHERREATRRVLAAQEAERLRVAQELHDEVGQTLTAILLQLAHAARSAPRELAAQLVETREAARQCLEDVRRIARELRPEALDDLGLPSALIALAGRLDAGMGVRVRCAIDRDLPQLSDEQELVVYRIAQEALTNVARHSGSAVADLRLGLGAGRIVLSIVDQGRGVAGAPEGGGLRGMRERAELVSATFTVTALDEGGTAVELAVPLEAAAA